MVERMVEISQTHNTQHTHNTHTTHTHTQQHKTDLVFVHLQTLLFYIILIEYLNFF